MCGLVALGPLPLQAGFSASLTTPSLVDKLASAVAGVAVEQPVQTLLRCVGSLIGRAVLDERLLSCLLMQNAVGALANLAQQEQVRVLLFAD